jgi:hypothetical protein
MYRVRGKGEIYRKKSQRYNGTSFIGKEGEMYKTKKCLDQLNSDFPLFFFDFEIYNRKVAVSDCFLYRRRSSMNL